MHRAAAPTSIAIHAAFVTALILLTYLTPEITPKLSHAGEPVRLLMPFLPRVTPDAGGGGGHRESLPVPLGEAPRFAPRALIPPTTHRPDHMPAIAIEPAIELQSAAKLDVASIGDPFGKPGLPSDGPGRCCGVGPGDGGPYGSGKGPGIGPGGGPGISGSARIAGATPPALLYKVEPEFSEEARKARLTGVVQLVAVIDASGQVGAITIRQGLGLGLDERAIEAVRKWKFRPAMRNGKAVASPAFIEVMFHLL